MFNRKNFFSLLLTAIFAVGLFLRIYQLESFPVGFHIDEASKGYTAYSLLKTGKDDNNKSFPLYIDIFGDNSPSGYHLSAIPSVALFGLTEFAVRIPGALFGALTILVCYFLAYALFKDKKVSLLSALLLALAPWHINLSRASSESLISLFFIMLGFSLLIWGLKTQVTKHLVAGTFFLSLSFFFYQTPRVFVPLLFFVIGIFVLWIWKIPLKKHFKKTFIYCFLLLSLLDVFLIFAVPGGTGRFTQVNIFNYADTRLVMEEQIRQDAVSGVSLPVTRFFHNKVVDYFLSYTSNYLDYLSWSFLFMEGLPQWYFVPRMGVLYLFELPFVIYGLFLLAFHKEKLYRIPLLWLLLAPTIASIAIDTNNLQRALVMFPILEIIAAYGMVHLFMKFSKRKRLVLICIATVLYMLNFVYFLHQYFVHTKVHRPWYRNNGFTQMMQVVKQSYNTYDKVVMTTSTGGTYPLVQFHMQYDPRTYQLEGSPKDKEYRGFGKFFFVRLECPSLKRNKRFPQEKHIIYVNNGTCPTDKKHKEITILKEDGSPAFRIVYGDIKTK